MGVWLQVDDAVYDVTYRALQFDTAGAFIGHRKGSLHITLDPSGDSFTGLLRTVTSDPSGVESAPIEGTLGGTRLVGEPFA